MTLAELSGVDDDSRIAVEEGTTRLTWRELDQRTNQFANGLESHGATPGSHVALCVSNRVDFVVAPRMLALIRCASPRGEFPPRASWFLCV